MVNVGAVLYRLVYVERYHEFIIKFLQKAMEILLAKLFDAGRASK